MMIPASLLNLSNSNSSTMSISNSSTMSVVRMSSHMILSRSPLGVRYMTHNHENDFYHDDDFPWIEKCHPYLSRLKSDKDKVNHERVFKMWVSFYKKVILDNEYLMKTDFMECIPIKNDFIYKQAVFKRLDEYRDNENSEECLRDIQRFIESSSLEFDEKSIYKSVPILLKKLISTDPVQKDESSLSAREYLYSSNKLTDLNQNLLNEMGPYTLEALLIHVLSTVFNVVGSNTVIRLTTLIDRIDSSIRSQAIILRKRRYQKENKIFHPEKEKTKECKTDFYFGTELVEFLQKKALIEVTSIGIDDDQIRKKNGDFYKSKHQNVNTLFDVSELPIRFTLPMVCKPEDWTSTTPEPKYLSELRGGYLSSYTDDIKDRYRLLSSMNLDSYYIELNEDYEKLCSIMNKLQNEPFEINGNFLAYIRENESLLVENGLLLPGYISKLKLKNVYDILHKEYYDSKIPKSINFSIFTKELCLNIQRSSYEQYLLKLAITYEGYRFYLPAFIDFRGRIYRSGILHFHERDLARSLIIFAKNEKNSSSTYNITTHLLFLEAASFHYKAFPNNDAGRRWLGETLFKDDSFISDNEKLIKFACGAKKPLQFLSCTSVHKLMLSDKDLFIRTISCYPITQDASASAYQIMSYLLLDITLAKHTNLIPTKDEVGNINIQDIYSYILVQLQKYLNENYQDNTVILNVSKILTHKLVKAIFMPIIYGKTIQTTAVALKEYLKIDLDKKSLLVAKAFYKFFEKEYSIMYCLMKLLGDIGWFASKMDRPVSYKVPLYTTIQDYQLNKITQISVYDKFSNKRRKVTFTIPCDERNTRKTKIATFVNFIHQKDAHIVMSVIDMMIIDDSPIYTVHDNFLSTLAFSSGLPYKYIKSFRDMGPPLLLINEFIYMNLTKTGFHNSEKVISSGELESILNNCIPVEMRKKKNTWTKKSKVIINSYNTYINAVCGPRDPLKSNDDRWFEHHRKWYSYRNELRAQYCLHY